MKIGTAIYPSKVKRAVVKFCMGSVWTIWHISFFDLEKQILGRGSGGPVEVTWLEDICALARGHICPG